MHYVKTEPHPVKRLLPTEERDAYVRMLPAEERRTRRLIPTCADCMEGVAMDKLGRYRHVEG